jgi:hypothetical protein
MGAPHCTQYAAHIMWPLPTSPTSRTAAAAAGRRRFTRAEAAPRHPAAASARQLLQGAHAVDVAWLQRNLEVRTGFRDRRPQSASRAYTPGGPSKAHI